MGRRRVSDLYGVPAEELQARIEALAVDALREDQPLVLRALVPSDRLGLEEVHLDGGRLGTSSLRSESRAIARSLTESEIASAQIALCYSHTAPALTFTLHRSVTQSAGDAGSEVDLGVRDALRNPKEPQDKARAVGFDQQWTALSALAAATRR